MTQIGKAMSISELSLRRPVLAIVMNILIVLFGPLVLVFLAYAIIRRSIRQHQCANELPGANATSLSRNHRTLENQSMASPGSRTSPPIPTPHSNINIDLI